MDAEYEIHEGEVIDSEASIMVRHNLVPIFDPKSNNLQDKK
jgi:hypothetical protein